MTESKTPAKRRAKVSRKGKQLSSTERAEAIALWRAGSTTLDELAKKFDRNRLTFIRLFNSEGVTKGEAARAHQQKVTEAVEATALGDAAILATRVRETKEEHYKYATALGRETFKVLVEAKKQGRAIGTAINDLKALQVAAATIKLVREEKYALLGLNDDSANDDKPLPDLVLKELSEDDIKALNQAKVSDDDLNMGGYTEIEENDGSLPE